MRTLMLTLAAPCLIVSIAQAQTMKIETTWNCGPNTAEHALPVGDQPNHVYVLQQGKCTTTKGEIAGIRQKEGTPTEFMDGMGNTGKGHGTFVETLANGDKIIYTYEFTGTMNGKVLTSGSNKWTIVSGTGKLTGIKGSGTCTGKGNADGSAVYTCTGSYSMAK